MTMTKIELPWDRHEQAEMPADDDLHAFVDGRYVPVAVVDGKVVPRATEAPPSA
jgi:hypothetical protein